MAGLTKKSKSYYALFPVDGKTKWKRIGIMPYKDALKVLKDMEAKFDKEGIGFIEIKPITSKEYKPHYLRYSKGNKAYNSWRRDITSLKALSEFFDDMLLSTIGNREIEL